MGLDRDDAKVLPLPAQLVLDEGEREPAEVRAAADAADEDVRAIARHLELALRLQPDDRLVRQDVVQHRAERVLRVLPLAASSTASEIAMPRLPGDVRVLGEHRTAGGRLRDGLATTFPPQASIIMRRYGFWW